MAQACASEQLGAASRAKLSGALGSRLLGGK
jgi:hypothetical protein